MLVYMCLWLVAICVVILGYWGIITCVKYSKLHKYLIICRVDTVTAYTNYKCRSRALPSLKMTSNSVPTTTDDDFILPE